MRRVGAAGLATVVVVTAAGYFLWNHDGPKPRSRTQEPDVVSVVSVGDILLGDAAEGVLQERGYDHPFKRVGRLLDGADIVMGNLEGPVTEHTTPFAASKSYTYKQRPEAAQALANAGFDALTLGNNHALDYGWSGMAETLQQLRRVDIKAFGAGADEAASREGILLASKGVTIALLSYMQPYESYEELRWYAAAKTPGVARLELEQVAEDIRRMRARADVIIVHAHFGENYRRVTAYQREVARKIIDAGADAVNGHHPHVAQGVDIYRGKPIVYSLGNFAFGTPGRFGKDEPGYGLVMRYNISVATKRVVSVEFDLISTNNQQVRFQPQLVGSDEARRVWTDINIGFTAAARWEGSTAVIVLPSP